MKEQNNESYSRKKQNKYKRRNEMQKNKMSRNCSSARILKKKKIIKAKGETKQKKQNMHENESYGQSAETKEKYENNKCEMGKKARNTKIKGKIRANRKRKTEESKWRTEVKK